MKTKLTIALMLLFGTASAQTFTNYTTTDGLLNNNVICLDVSNSDILWFGTQTGISVFDGTNWTSHTNASDSGLVNNNIQAIKVLSSGAVWAGTDFGACYYDGSSWTTYTTADGLGNNQIKCIEEDASGNVWFGTNSGASYFDGATWTNVGTSDGLPFGGVTAISFDANGDVFLGSGLGGIAIYNGAIGTILTEANNGLIDDRMRGIRIMSNGDRWVGTSEGVSVLDASNVVTDYHSQMYTLPAPDTLNPIEDLEIDNFGNVWVGVYVDYLVTEGGVCAYDGSSWTEYHVADGLVGPVVRALTIDSENSVWVATSSGVSKISNHEVSTEELTTESFQLYPNPTAGTVTINVVDENIDATLSIYNASLQLVEQFSEEVHGGTVKFSVAHLSSGVYFVRYNGVSKKLIKE